MTERLGVERSHGVEAERAQWAGRQVAIALVRGNAEQAHAIIDRTLRPIALPKSRAEVLKLPISESGLEVRIVNQLEVYGIYTIGQLLNTTRETLLAYPDFGPASLTKVLAAVARLGFVSTDINHA